MITKINKRSRRNNNSDYEYIGDGVMINPSQKRTLIDLIYRNFQEEDRENRLLEIDNLTSVEAEEMIFEFLSATWN
jgi:hypothetical protein